MALLQSIKTACGERVGADGIAPVAFEKALAGTAEALVQLRAQHADAHLAAPAPAAAARRSR